jgi:hypothetical protein
MAGIFTLLHSPYNDMLKGHLLDGQKSALGASPDRFCLFLPLTAYHRVYGAARRPGRVAHLLMACEYAIPSGSCFQWSTLQWA